MADPARESALNILHRVDRKQLTLDTIMDDFNKEQKHLDKRDMALIHALVFGVIRWRLHLDHIIGHFSNTPLEKIHPDVLNILRLGVYQLKFMTRIPESAAVNTSVELAKKVEISKKRGPVWLVKFVNGVLRNAARQMASVPFPALEQNRTVSISLSQSFPTWLVQKWLDRFGEEETLRICEYLNSIPDITVRVNTLKTEKKALMDALEPCVAEIHPTSLAEQGLSFTRPNIPMDQMESFKSGWFQVQDEGAQLVTEILCPLPGERVLDACAGLGGKTGHMAQLMKNQGQIIALDHDDKKLRRLKNEMARLGVTLVETIRKDLDEPLEPDSLGLFDKILLDAPCSGMGVIRRNPDSKWNLTKKNLNRFNKRQVRFLSAVSQFLKPDGTLVYAVCSTEPEENEGVVESFLHKHPDFEIAQPLHPVPESIRSLETSRGLYMSVPHIHGMDGFFMACLRRRH